MKLKLSRENNPMFFFINPGTYQIISMRVICLYDIFGIGLTELDESNS